MIERKVPDVVIRRLPLYLRVLEILMELNHRLSLRNNWRKRLDFIRTSSERFVLFWCLW